MQDRKAELRARTLTSRSRLSVAERDLAGRSLRDCVLQLPEMGMAGTVVAYYSVGTEPGTRQLVYALWKRGTYVLLPLLLPDGDLDWASYEGPDSLVSGPRRLLEPGEPPRGRDAVSRADVVLVPALAVDQAGNRLGRGGGSFDRALARVAPTIPVIALLYDDELVDEVPTAPHDRPVTHVARPTPGLTPLPRPTAPPNCPAQLTPARQPPKGYVAPEPPSHGVRGARTPLAGSGCAGNAESAGGSRGWICLAVGYREC